MIRTFADECTKAASEGVQTKGLGPNVRPSARKKLLMIDRSAGLADLRAPPGNLLEALKERTNHEHPRNAAVDYAEVIDRDAQRVGAIHPGEILREEFLEPLGLSACALAKAISVPRNRITGIVHGERAITADTALRFARFFDMSPDFWLGLQMAYDLETTRAALAGRLNQEVIPRAA